MEDQIKLVYDETSKSIQELKQLMADKEQTPEVIEQKRQEVIQKSKECIGVNNKALEGIRKRKMQEADRKLEKLTEERLKCTNPEEYARVDKKIEKVNAEKKEIENYGHEFNEEVIKTVSGLGITAKDLGVEENNKEPKKRSNFIARFFAALFGKFKIPERKKEYKQSPRKDKKTVRQKIRETLDSAFEWADAILDEEIADMVDETPNAEDKTTTKSEEQGNRDKKQQEPKENTEDAHKMDSFKESMKKDFEEYFAKVEEGYEDILPKAYISYKTKLIKEYINNQDDLKEYSKQEMLGQSGFEKIYTTKKHLIDYCHDAIDVLNAENDKDKAELKKYENDKDKNGKPKNQKEISKLKGRIAKKNKEIGSLRKALKDIEARRKEIMDKEQHGDESKNGEGQQEPQQPMTIKEKMEYELMAYFNEVQIDYGKDLLPQEYYDEIAKIIEETINDSNLINQYKADGIEGIVSSDKDIMYWIMLVQVRFNRELTAYENQYKDKNYMPIDYPKVIRKLESKIESINKAIPEIEQRCEEIENSTQQPPLSEEDIIKNKMSMVLYGKFDEWHEGYNDLLTEEYTKWFYDELDKIINDEDIIAQVEQEGIEWYKESLGHFDNENTKVNWIFSNVDEFINEYIKDENAKQVVYESILEMREKIQQRYEEKYKEHENDGNDEHEEGDNPPANSIPEAKFDIKTAKYTIKDKDGNIVEHDFDKKLLNKKAQQAFALELMDKYAAKSIFEDVEMKIEKAKALSDKMDINLYRLYEAYDEKYNTLLAPQYIDAMRFKTVPAPTKMTYDLTTIGSKVQTPFLNRGDIKKLAEIHEKFELAEVERNPKMSIGKKIAIGLGIGGTVAAIGIGASAISNLNNQKDLNNNQNIEKTDENVPVVDLNDLGINTPEEKPTIESKKTSFKESMKVSGIEQSVKVLKQQVKEQLENKIEIGSKAILEEGTYFYDSEGNGPTGKIENRQNKEVEITLIATVNEDGKYEHCLMDGNIADAKQLGENVKIMVAIRNKDGDLGWISFDEVKDNFIDYMNQQQSQEAVK